jgi:carbohydrate-binding DOMON domain-containing protein
MVAVLLCALAAPALAQKPFNGPVLTDKPKGGFGAQTTTPTPTPTARATATATRTATATPTATATARPGRRGEPLANTGADPVRLALAGLTLLGFGFSLRLRLALADVRRPG